MAVRFTVRRLLLLTAFIAFALAMYVEVIREQLSYHRDETVVPMTPMPKAPIHPLAK